MEEILIAQQFDVGEEKDNGHIWYRSYIAHWASPLTVAWTEPFVQIYTKFAKIFNHILKIYALN